MTPIYFLIPTRCRPVKLQRSIESIKRMATHPDRVKALLYVDHDDPTEYPGHQYIHHGPPLGYAGLHVMYSTLAKWACELDGSGPPGWQIMWNDDELMLTQGYDGKLLQHGDAPKVVFMRRDCYAMGDTAYPAWPRSLVELTGGVIGGNSACDTWLASLTGAADRLIGRTTTHVRALDIVVRHDRDEADRHASPNLVASPDLGVAGGIELHAFKLAAHHQAPAFAPPFGLDRAGFAITR